MDGHRRVIVVPVGLEVLDAERALLAVDLDGEARGRVPLLDAGVARRIAQVTDEEEAHSGGE